MDIPEIPATRRTPRRSSTVPPANLSSSKKRTPLQELDSNAPQKREKIVIPLLHIKRSVSFAEQSESRMFRWQEPSVALGEVQNEVTKTKTPPSRRAYFTAQNTTKSLQELTIEDDEEFSFIDRSVPPPPPQRVEDETHFSLHQLTLDEDEEEEPDMLPAPQKRPLIEVLWETTATFDRQFSSSSSSSSVEKHDSDEDTVLLDQVEVDEMQSTLLLLLPEAEEELKGSDTELDNISEDTELVPTTSSSSDNEATQEVEVEFKDGYLTDVVRTSSEEDGNATELVPTDDEHGQDQRVMTVIEPEPIIAERPTLRPLVGKPPPPRPKPQIKPIAQVIEVIASPTAITLPPVAKAPLPPPAAVGLPPPPIAATVEVDELKRIEDDLVNSLPATANLSVRDIVQHVLTMMFHGPAPQQQQEESDPIDLLPPPPVLVQEEYVPPSDLPPSSPPPPAEQVVSRRRGKNRLVLRADTFDETAFTFLTAEHQVVDLSRYIHLASTGKTQQVTLQRRQHQTSKKYPLHALSVRRRRRF